MKKDIYIKLLEFADKHPEGFNFKMINEDSGLNLNDWESAILTKNLRTAYMNETNELNAPERETLFKCINYGGGWSGEVSLYIANINSRFNYIDYQELKYAMRNSRTAIWIAIITMLVSIGCSIWQIYSPVKIIDNQFNEMKRLINNKI